MYRIIILSLVSSVILAQYIMDKRLCGRVFQPNSMFCCRNNSESIYKITMTDDIRECFQVSKDPTSCEREICIAQKKGFAADDNKIDKVKLEEILTKDLGTNAELLEDVITNCLNGNIEKYAPPDFCNFMKMRHCVSMQILNYCQEWNKNVECQETKKLVRECVKILT